MRHHIFSLCLVFLVLGCKPQAKIQEKNEVPKENPTESDEVIIRLHSAEYAEGLIVDFKEFGLMLSKQLMPSPPMFLYRFDTSKIKGDDLLERLRASDKVKECQLNRKVKPR